jgi:hypothetical protein
MMVSDKNLKSYCNVSRIGKPSHIGNYHSSCNGSYKISKLRSSSNKVEGRHASTLFISVGKL